MNTVRNAMALHCTNYGDRVLEDSFGDGYLYNNNIVFHSMRNEALRLGYRFSHAPHHYIIAPMLGLIDILQNKTVYYFPNYTVLAEIEENQKTFATADDLNSIGFKENRILHETAHCVAFSHLYPDAQKSDVPHILRSRRRLDIVKAISGEAFSILVDRVFHYNCRHLNASERLLHQFNSNPLIKRDIGLNDEFHKAIELVGPSKAYLLTFFMGLISDYLYVRPSLGQKLRASELASINEADARALINGPFETFWNMQFQISIVFRYEVKRLYFKHLGFQSSPKKLVSHDPLLEYERNDDLLMRIKKLIELLSE